MAEIASVHLTTHPLVLELTGKRTPRTGLEGKFSVFHAAAVALLHGDGAPTAFTDDLVNDPAVISLRDRIDATPDAIPVLGESRQVGGFIFATGFSGHGLALGPIAGKLTAELIADGQPSLDIHHMDYARFAEGRVGKPKSVV